MKSLLLTAAMLLAVAGGASAQNLPPEYRWEIGANGGLSTITRPVGPPDGYRGTRTNIVRDFGLRASYYFNWRWMISLDVSDRRWESVGQWEFYDRFNRMLTPMDVKFRLADHALMENVQMNHVIPFYTRFNAFNRANLYFGVHAGLVQTLNDGSSQYSVNPQASDSGHVYVSGVHYGAGRGMDFGVQGGFIYYIVPRLGVTAELSMRYVTVNTFHDRNAAGISNFQLLQFPQTVGIRYRLY